HGEGLLGMVGYQSRTFEHFPFERARACAARNKESVPLIDLCEVHRNIADAFRKRIPTGGHRRLHDIDLALPEHFVLTALRRLLEISRTQSFVFEESAGNRGNERTVKDGVAVNHDAQLSAGHNVSGGGRNAFASRDLRRGRHRSIYGASKILPA